MLAHRSSEAVIFACVIEGRLPMRAARSSIENMVRVFVETMSMLGAKLFPGCYVTMADWTDLSK